MPFICQKIVFRLTAKDSKILKDSNKYQITNRVVTKKDIFIFACILKKIHIVQKEN